MYKSIHPPEGAQQNSGRGSIPPPPEEAEEVVQLKIVNVLV